LGFGELGSHRFKVVTLTQPQVQEPSTYWSLHSYRRRRRSTGNTGAARCALCKPVERSC